MFDLSKRAVVLTGATGNIGPTVLRAYLAQGCHRFGPAGYDGDPAERRYKLLSGVRGFDHAGERSRSRPPKQHHSQ